VNVFHINNTDKVVAFHRWLNGGTGDDVVVVMNFANRYYTDYNIGMPKSGRWRVRFNSDWNGYDASFANWNAYDTQAFAGSKDGLACNANIGLGAYSVVVLSQGTTPDINLSGMVDFRDMSVLADYWMESCDSWDACGGADFDMSGAVGFGDLYRFLGEWLR
jgi:1,4-alpha-glucan branching enzyme